MQKTETSENTLRKRVTGRALVLFIGMLVLLTFFSNTINNFTLPRVTVEEPRPGDIVKDIRGEGVVKAKKISEVYTPISARVEKVNVEKWDKVKKGQVLMALDTTELERNLKDETARYEQKKLNLEKLIENSKSEEFNSDERSVADAWEKLEQQKKSYANSKALYEAGAESRQNFEKAEADLENARQTYEAAKYNLQKAARDSDRDINSFKLEMEIQQRTIEKLKEDGTAAGAVTAPCDGIIAEINFREGALANTSTPLFKIIDSAEGFQLKVTLDKDKAKYLTNGEEVEVSAEAVSDRVINGRIIDISDNEQQKDEKKDIYIDLKVDGLTGGEHGEINLKKRVKTTGVLVSNEAIHEDNHGEFILVVRERKGALGTEYYVQEVRVDAGETDDAKTAINGGVLLGEIVVKSSKPLEDGDRVMVEK